MPVEASLIAKSTTGSGTIALVWSVTTSSYLHGHSNGTTANTVWNDKMGCWHYTNYPEGFGYFTNSTLEGKNKKQQLNDW